MRPAGLALSQAEPLHELYKDGNISEGRVKVNREDLDFASWTALLIVLAVLVTLGVVYG